MIFDRIARRACYESDAGLAKVLEYLASAQTAGFPKEGVQLDGDRLFVNPVCFESKPETERLFEAHRKYADVHFIIEGTETIIVKDLDEVENVTPFDEDKDIGFYQAEGGTVCVLHPGDFLVCYAHDAHKPGIATDGRPMSVKKLVGKIRLF